MTCEKLSVEERRDRIRKAVGDSDQLILIHAYQYGNVYTIATKKEDCDFIAAYIKRVFRATHCGDLSSNENTLTYDGGEEGYFSGHRLMDDLIAINAGWKCIDILPALPLGNAHSHEAGMYVIFPRLYFDYKDCLCVYEDYCAEIAHAIIGQIIENLKEIGFVTIREDSIYRTRKNGIVETNEPSIIQMPTGEFVTHSTCRSCGLTAFCMKFDNMEEAIGYRDDKDSVCSDCCIEEFIASRLCKYCEKRYDCPHDKMESNTGKCKKFEYDEFWYDGDDEWDDDLCACPLEED